MPSKRVVVASSDPAVIGTEPHKGVVPKPSVDQCCGDVDHSHIEHVKHVGVRIIPHFWVIGGLPRRRQLVRRVNLRIWVA